MQKWLSFLNAQLIHTFVFLFLEKQLMVHQHRSLLNNLNHIFLHYLIDYISIVFFFALNAYYMYIADMQRHTSSIAVLRENLKKFDHYTIVAFNFLLGRDSYQNSVCEIDLPFCMSGIWLSIHHDF